MIFFLQKKLNLLKFVFVLGVCAIIASVSLVFAQTEAKNNPPPPQLAPNGSDVDIPIPSISI